jgi:CRP-like cAMP-binding protein
MPLQEQSVSVRNIAVVRNFVDLRQIPPRRAALFPDPLSNHLLAALPDADWRRWRLELDLVELPLGQVLCQPGHLMRHAYFPTTAIVSLLHLLENGASAEIATVGNEGMVGISLITGGGSTPSQAVVQSAGQAFRISASTIKEEFNRSAAVLRLLLSYLQSRMTQTAQTAVCNCHHLLEQRLSRWLLGCLDRLQGNELAITQELLAHILGVRREGVTECTLKLQKLGLIHYRRGHLTVLDREGLEERTCECYAIVKKECERLRPERMAA